MVGSAFWTALFDALVHLYNWAVSTNAVSWSDDSGSHSISFFTVWISLTVLEIVIGVIFAFVDNHNSEE